MSPMRRTIRSRRRLTATLTRALEVKASQTPEMPPFDPAQAHRMPVTSGSASLDGSVPTGDGRDAWSPEALGSGPPAGRVAGDDRRRGSVIDGAVTGARHTGPPRPRRRLLVPAAVTAMAVTGALVGAALVARDAGPGDVATVPTVPPGPGEWLVPAWLPDGMDVWDVEWQGDSPEPEGGDGWSNFQLFGDPDAGRALYIQAGPQYSQDVEDAERITVRGQSGWAGPSIDTELPVDGITWTEGGANIMALFKGMTSAEAIAAVEAMQWRSGTPERGFAPPADGSLPLRGESLDAQRDSTRGATFVYSEDIPTSEPSADRMTLVIHTETGQAMPLGYLDDWFYRGDEAPAHADGSRRAFDPESHELRVDWPDGREVFISPLIDPPSTQAPERDTLERIADSVVVATEADLMALRDRFEANVEAVPVLASTPTSIGTLEVHGVGAFNRLCLRRTDGSGLDCGEGPGLGGDLVVGWVIDGVWYVGVATIGHEPEIRGDRGGSEAEVLSGESRSDGDWSLQLVQPSPDIQNVSVATDATGNFIVTLARPS